VKKRKGFTMVELMVVIIIMAILGLAVIPSLMGSSDKAKYSRAWSDLTAISNAFTAFYGRVGNLPDVSVSESESEAGAWTLTIGTGSEWTNAGIDATNAKDLLQSFLGKPIDKLKDPWGANYQIASSWDPDDGTGAIIVYVTGGSGSVSFGTDADEDVKDVRTDPYNNNKVMAKLVINVPTGEETGDQTP